MRASDLARERAAGLLRRRCDEGYLSLDTFERRLADVFQAKDRDELAGLTADLPAIGIVGRLRRWQFSRRVGRSPVPEAGVRLPLELVSGRALVLGRSRHCDIVLNNDSVSRKHAEIGRTEDGWYLRDLNSSNGTRVDGAAITGAERVVRGDVVLLGGCQVHLL